MYVFTYISKWSKEVISKNGYYYCLISGDQACVRIITNIRHQIKDNINNN